MCDSTKDNGLCCQLGPIHKLRHTNVTIFDPSLHDVIKDCLIFIFSLWAPLGWVSNERLRTNRISYSKPSAALAAQFPSNPRSPKLCLRSGTIFKPKSSDMVWQPLKRCTQDSYMAIKRFRNSMHLLSLNGSC